MLLSVGNIKISPKFIELRGYLLDVNINSHRLERIDLVVDRIVLEVPHHILFGDIQSHEVISLTRLNYPYCGLLPALRPNVL